MLGVANGLLGSGVLSELAGNVAFFAVPAEEYVEIDYRVGLRAQGQTEFLGGKGEMIRLGAFDDIDMAMMVHARQRRATGSDRPASAPRTTASSASRRASSAKPRMPAARRIAASTRSTPRSWRSRPSTPSARRSATTTPCASIRS